MRQSHPFKNPTASHPSLFWCAYSVWEKWSRRCRSVPLVLKWLLLQSTNRNRACSGFSAWAVSHLGQWWWGRRSSRARWSRRCRAAPPWAASSRTSSSLGVSRLQRAGAELPVSPPEMSSFFTGGSLSSAALLARSHLILYRRFTLEDLFAFVALPWHEGMFSCPCPEETLNIQEGRKYIWESC